MARTQTKPWDPAERLETKEDMAAYLNVALEEGDLSLIIVTLGDIARARRMALVAQETGLGRESLYKSLSADGNPEFATVPEGGARPGTPASRDRSAGSNRRTGYPVFGSAPGVVADLNRRTLDGVRLHYAMEANLKMVRLVFAIAVLMSFCLSCIGGPEVVRMGTEGAYPPYNFINDKGEVDGFERELGDELCRRADLECVWVTNEWDSIIPNLLEGKYDTIMAGMSITDERDEVIDFTQPYIPPSPSVYVALVGAGDEAVAGRVAAQVATIQADYLSESGATLVEYELAEDVFSAVLRGEADATLVDIGFAHEYMTKSGEGLAIVGPQVMLDAGTGIGVRETDGALKDKLARAIDAMKQDGSLNALIEKWFGPDAETF